MGESAVLFHSYSFAAPRNDSHEDHTVHALSQSISFGRFMTENLEWGKWSSFSHKKYVDEAEKYSKPGSVAQKKAFFDAYYKKIADAKKSKPSSNESKQPESVEVLLNTLGTLTKDEVKEEENGGNELGLNSIEEDEEIERKSVAVLEQEDEEIKSESVAVLGEEEDEDESMVDKHVVADDLQVVHEVLDHIEDEDMLKKSGSIGGKEEERVVNKKLETPEKAISEKPITHSSEKKKEKSVHQKFSLLRFLMGNTKTQDQNQTKKKRKAKKKPFLCLCFNPEMVGETEGAAKVFPGTPEKKVGDKK